MRTVDDLFREYVRVFSFPEYFGWNWAAFAEYITELTGAPAQSYLTVVSQANRVLENDPLDRHTYLRQLNGIGKFWANSFGLPAEWGGGEVPFNSILLVPQPDQALSVEVASVE
jgi:hypothetical protein